MPADSLEPLLEVMQNRSDDATKRLGQLIAAEQDAKARLQLLIQYRDEYAERFRQAAQQGLSHMEWRNFQDFMGRIDEAVAHQRTQVIASQQNTAAGQADWIFHRNKLKAVGTLYAKRQAAEAYTANRRDQKSQDEFAARNREEKE